MENKEKILIAITVLAVAILFLIVYLFNQDNSFIKIRLYDKDGKIINSPLSVSTIPLSYFMDITLSVENNGNVNLNCYPNKILPIEWDNATNKNSITVFSGLSAEWTSSLINLSQFAGRPQPTRFNATVTCSYSDINGIHYINQSGYVDYNIGPVCGDNYCDSTENEITCYNDCFMGDKVRFRTSDLVYGINSAIAYTNNCGDDLNRYGIEYSTCWSVTNINCPSRSGYTLILNQSYNLQGRPIWAGSNIGCFYSDNANSTKVAMAWKVVSTSGSTCAVSGYWGIKVYSKTSPKAENVNNSKFHIEGNVNEVNC